jgi:glucose-6-phosphate 1-dehydrogenase
MIERFVLFGASGDLAARLLLPSLARLVEEHAVPATLRVIGSGTDDMSADDFKNHIAGALAEHADAVDEDARQRVVDALQYVSADVTDASDVAKVLKVGSGPALVYLALPPGVFEPALQALASAGLDAGSALAIEKPFGTGLASARELNEILHTRLPEVPVFRVDHFLSDELVQRVFALRFANRVFEPIWNRDSIEAVDVVWDETLTLEGRAGYYDRAGALRDMIQSHLLAAMSLVAMEQPSRRDERSIRDARVAVLRAVPTPDTATVQHASVRGRYTAGDIAGRKVPSYVDEPGVDPSRNTETYAELTVELNNWRWSGVPFRLRSGKALARDHAEIDVQFKRPPFRGPGVDGAVANVLRIGLLDPYVRLNVNVNAGRLTLQSSDLELESRPPSRPAYANLILHMLQADTTLAIRSDETEEMWRIVEPVLDAWAQGASPILDYPAGSDGPAQSPRAAPAK